MPPLLRAAGPFGTGQVNRLPLDQPGTSQHPAPKQGVMQSTFPGVIDIFFVSITWCRQDKCRLLTEGFAGENQAAHESTPMKNFSQVTAIKMNSPKIRCSYDYACIQ